jgi:hypothetical protein
MIVLVVVLLFTLLFPSMGVRFVDWSTYSLYKRIGILSFGLSLFSLLLISLLSNIPPFNTKYSVVFWDDLLVTQESITINNQEWEEEKRIPTVDVKQIILSTHEFTNNKQETIYRTFLQVISNNKERLDLKAVFTSRDSNANQDFYTRMYQFFEFNYRITPRKKAPVPKISFFTLPFGLGIVAGVLLILLF